MGHAVGTLKALQETDPEVFAAIRAEEKRQREKLVFIASENYASSAVLAAQGCLMTNKYAEGYPRRRHQPARGPADPPPSGSRKRSRWQ